MPRYRSIRLVLTPLYCPPPLPVLVSPNLGMVRKSRVQLTSFFGRSFPSAVFKRFRTSKWHTFRFINARFLLSLFIGHIQEMPQLGWERLLRGKGARAFTLQRRVALEFLKNFSG